MKSPAFQVYVNDFLGSAKVGMMDGQQVGIYWMLLLLDWQENGFELEPEPLSRWCRVSLEDFSRSWPLISRCFEKKRGRMFNPRLELERKKQEAWREKSSKGGLMGAHKRWHPNDGGGQEMVTTKASPTDDTPLPLPLPTPLTTKATTTTSPQKAAAGKDTWLTSFADAWKARFGGKIDFGIAAKVLSPLVKEHGEAETFRRWEFFLAAASGQYVSVPRFASTFGEWDGTAKQKTNGKLSAGEKMAESMKRVFSGEAK